ncbi:hypothetical protein JVU11DRAFT_1204 [Chiua virens]|nr:hypothetical protein JVU11DRAFT_1204 [Chiua virens]
MTSSVYERNGQKYDPEYVFYAAEKLWAQLLNPPINGLFKENVENPPDADGRESNEGDWLDNILSKIQRNHAELQVGVKESSASTRMTHQECKVAVKENNKETERTSAFLKMLEKVGDPMLFEGIMMHADEQVYQQLRERQPGDEIDPEPMDHADESGDEMMTS